MNRPINIPTVLATRNVDMLVLHRVRERASRLFQLGATAIMASIVAMVSCVSLKAQDAPANASPEVKFVTSDKQFAAGDEIVIEKVFCSSPNFTIGDRVTVKGRYTLASQADARLSLFLTSAEGGKERIAPEQTTLVQRGNGVFELSHTIRYNGRLHVSFYPTQHGSVLGGVYFGKQEQAALATSPPQDVKFVTGEKRLAAGDDIVIEKVSCSSPNFAVGDRVVVKGRYSLASEADARLSLYLTSIKPSGKWPVSPEQTITVQRGTGAFELSHIIPTEGVLHVSFYPTKGGNDLGGVYFGTLKQVSDITQAFASRKPQSTVGGSQTHPEAPALTHTLPVTPEIKRAFQAGDAIEIRQVTGSVPKFQVGGTYRVIGVCRQQTLKNASLYLGNTAEAGAEAIVPLAGSSLSKTLPNGTTEFDITFALRRPGLLHVTIYDLDNHDKHDNAYAGLYLGDVVFKR